MYKGDKVTIYHDPITKAKPIGEAELLNRRGVIAEHEGHPLEFWNVRFEDGFHALKLIYNTTISV